MMTRELVSRRLRNAFREALVSWTLREIDDEFGAEGFDPDPNYVPSVTGDRRSRVEQYYKRIDFSQPAQVRRLLGVYQEVMIRLARESSSGSWNRDSSTKRLEDLERRLMQDGYSYADGRITANATTVGLVDGIPHRIDAPELTRQIDRLRTSVDDDPALAVGTAKELVETVCKTILEDHGLTVDSEWDVARLMKEARTLLHLMPEQIPDATRGAEAIKKLLGSLSTISHGLSELRNLYGTGHGRSAKARGILPRHARLAVGAATTLASFMLETHAAWRAQKDGGHKTA